MFGHYVTEHPIYLITEYKITTKPTTFHMHFFLRYHWSLSSSRNASHFMELMVYQHVHINRAPFPLISQKQSPHLPFTYLRFLLILSPHIHTGQMASFHQIAIPTSPLDSLLSHTCHIPHTSCHLSLINLIFDKQYKS